MNNEIKQTLETLEGSWSPRQLVFSAIAAVGFGAVFASVQTSYVVDMLADVPVSTDPWSSDAVVVFTGTGARVKNAFQAAGTKNPDQLVFISGAYAGTTLEKSLKALCMPAKTLQVAPENISYGYRARTTAGNAAETAQWLGQHPQIKNITVVTSEQHSQRAALEMARNIPPGVRYSFHLVDDAAQSPRQISIERMKFMCDWLSACRTLRKTDDGGRNLFSAAQVKVLREVALRKEQNEPQAECPALTH